MIKTKKFVSKCAYQLAYMYDPFLFTFSFSICKSYYMLKLFYIINKLNKQADHLLTEWHTDYFCWQSLKIKRKKNCLKLCFCNMISKNMNHQFFMFKLECSEEKVSSTKRVYAWLYDTHDTFKLKTLWYFFVNNICSCK